jgi:hypothetical protein
MVEDFMSLLNTATTLILELTAVAPSAGALDVTSGRGAAELLPLLLPPHAAIDTYSRDAKMAKIVFEYVCRILMLIPAIWNQRHTGCMTG